MVAKRQCVRIVYIEVHSQQDKKCGEEWIFNRFPEIIHTSMITFFVEFCQLKGVWRYIVFIVREKWANRRIFEFGLLQFCRLFLYLLSLLLGLDFLQLLQVF